MATRLCHPTRRRRCLRSLLNPAASAFGHLNHFDQIGRVDGDINLRGEKIAIDCFAMRNRSWGPRPEHRPRASTYVTGAAAANHGFLAVSCPADGDTVAFGFLLRDGVVRHFVKGRRIAERDPMSGVVSRLT